MQTGYCTNVHAGATIEQTQANLKQHALDVKRQFCPDEAMGVGLWLSDQAASDLLESNGVPAFREWLQDNELVPYTFNGFPYGDFHQPVVKHRVYEPTWMDAARCEYTSKLIRIQHELLEEGMAGSISTLPIGWGSPMPNDDALLQAASHLAEIVDELEQLAQRGRHITVNLEPEPGCVLDTADDVVRFYERFLDPVIGRERAFQHLGVCHDTCHAAVMFEDQSHVIERLRSEHINIGKVQVSSAVRLRTDNATFAEGVAQLSQFAEDRYLHQTMVRSGDSAPEFFEDLPAALRQIESRGAAESLEIRTHFHVPVYLERFGHLGTTQSEILDCLSSLRQHYPDMSHFEVETYAWGVLPEDLKQDSLANGIAQELDWFCKQG